MAEEQAAQGGSNHQHQHHNGNGSAIPHDSRTSMTDGCTSDQVASYLRAHPDFLERWVLEEVEMETVERWMIRGTQHSKRRPDAKNSRKTSLSRWKFCVHADKRQMLQELTKSLQRRPTKAHVLWELSSCISSAISADGFHLYLFEHGELGLYEGGDDDPETTEDPRLAPIGPDSVPAYVATNREILRFSKGDKDKRFPGGPPFRDGESHLLYHPVVQPDGQLAAVLALWRRDPGPQFHEEDEEIASSYLVWGGIALHYAHLYLSMNKQRKLNDFLLAVVKSIFQDMVSMDALVIKVMNFAQRLVDADRASLFLVDNRNKELYARIFDVGLAECEPSAGESGSDDCGKNSSQEIRFPVGTGIAGQVALTGEILNIVDAYEDPRFNRTIDQLTGYHTKTILCMPIFTKNNVIGVVQMVNKHSGTFTKEDEDAFEMFAVYCGLALHHAKLYDKIARSEQKYCVALEVLSYHNASSELEVNEARKLGIPDSLPGIDDYYFDVFKYDDFGKARQSIFMFKDLFGLSRFESDSLIRFTLTVKKNYRRVPYHNWTHGFSVAHCMYSIVKHSPGAFKPNEALALFIGSLCHDLDHRGKNNKFMLETESPLASIYSTSTMEHHHFNQTVTILQQKGHNIFAKLSSGEYKQVLSHVKHCILATDLALFFPNKARLAELTAKDQFSWTSSEHRLLLEAMCMTACDLSASAKPWDIQVETVKVIFEEFYEQGDAERAAGKTPIPMMDRYQPEQQASSQVGFLMGICIPCYTIMSKLLPETTPLLNQCQANLQRWRAIDAEVQRKLAEEKEGIGTPLPPPDIEAFPPPPGTPSPPPVPEGDIPVTTSSPLPEIEAPASGRPTPAPSPTLVSGRQTPVTSASPAPGSQTPGVSPTPVSGGRTPVHGESRRQTTAPSPTPAPGSQTPAPSPSPTPGSRTPAPSPTPAPGSQTPAPSPSPTPGSRTPAPSPTPTPGSRTPAPSPTPAPGSQTPAPLPTPTPGSQTPAPSPTPAPGSQTPAPSPTPAPGSQTPAPSPTPGEDPQPPMVPK